MVERERDEGGAKGLSGEPLQPPEGAAVSGKAAAAAGEGERDEEERGEGEERDGDGKEEEEEEWSEIRLAIEELSPAPLKPGGDGKPGASSPPTLCFLALAHLLLRVLDKIGPTMAVLRLDVQRNIEELYLLDPSKYATLTEIVEKEVKEGTARKVDSCARAVLWLTRSMDFTIALLQSLEGGSDQQSLAQLTEAAYTATLKPWHGWIASAAYKIAMKLIPERKIFTGMLVVGMDHDCSALKEEIEKLASLLQPLLDDIHAMMAKFRLDRLKST
ncbi:hypothetical protein BS78_06G102900 [Paspalum vaginatum]|nr:hypothetical protein BS78_06G102900 [Paspalum vaginatum]